MSRKKILLLTAKEAELPFILQAQMMGYYVVTTGNAPNQVGHKYSDEYIPFDYSDYEGITKMALDNGIEGILRGCSDNCALTAAYMCEKMKIGGHDSYITTEIIHRKDKFKEFAKRNNVKTPLADYYSSMEVAINAKHKYSSPIIVKPCDLAGGQGVAVIKNFEDYNSAIVRAFEWSNSKKIVVEPFLMGTLHSLHVFIVRQKVVAYGTANDYSFINPFMTSYGLFPADNEDIALKFLIPEIERIAGILNLVDGQMDIQYIMNGSEVWIIEMMRRSPGNHTTGVIGNSIGINWREWIIRAELGENVELIPESNRSKKYYGYYCVMGEHNGTFDRIVIEPEFRKYVLQIEEWMPRGHKIIDYMYEKMGIVLFAFNNFEEKNYYMPLIKDMIKMEYMEG